MPFQKMKIEERKPIWTALSDFYLDTELDELDFQFIAKKIYESPYSFDDIKNINKYELFPVLQTNLLSVAGEWAGFDEKWLIQRIIKSLERRNLITKFLIDCWFLIFSWMTKDYLKKTKIELNKLKPDSTSFLVTCKELYLKKIEPFEFNTNKTDLELKLENIAADFNSKNQILDFQHYLQELQYWIDVWAAYFILEIFDLKKAKEIDGLNINDLIDLCWRTVDRNKNYFKSDKAKINCEKWIESKKTAYNNGYN